MGRAKKLAVYLLAPMITAAGLSGVFVGPALADDIGRPGAYCPSGALCVWRDSHYRGSRYDFFGSNTSWHSWPIADEDSSSYNNGTSGLAVSIYTNTGYGGQRVVCLRRGSWASHHSPNDEGSSNRWVSSC